MLETILSASKIQKKCTKCMMYEWSKYHIILLHTTVSELLSELLKNSDLKRNQNHSWKFFDIGIDTINKEVA